MSPLNPLISAALFFSLASPSRAARDSAESLTDARLCSYRMDVEGSAKNRCAELTVEQLKARPADFDRYSKAAAARHQDVREAFHALNALRASHPKLLTDDDTEGGASAARKIMEALKEKGGPAAPAFNDRTFVSWYPDNANTPFVFAAWQSSLNEALRARRGEPGHGRDGPEYRAAIDKQLAERKARLMSMRAAVGDDPTGAKFKSFVEGSVPGQAGEDHAGGVFAGGPGASRPDDDRPLVLRPKVLGLDAPGRVPEPAAGPAPAPGLWDQAMDWSREKAAGLRRTGRNAVAWLSRKNEDAKIAHDVVAETALNTARDLSDRKLVGGVAADLGQAKLKSAEGRGRDNGAAFAKIGEEAWGTGYLLAGRCVEKCPGAYMRFMDVTTRAQIGDPAALKEVGAGAWHFASGILPSIWHDVKGAAQGWKRFATTDTDTYTGLKATGSTLLAVTDLWGVGEVTLAAKPLAQAGLRQAASAGGKAGLRGGVEAGGEQALKAGAEQSGRDLAEQGARKGVLEPARMQRAQSALSRSLSPEQQAAVQRAHEVGAGQLGKDGGVAGIGNYTPGQLRDKARLLRQAGFSPEEVRTLMENGIVGQETGAGALARTSEIPAARKQPAMVDTKTFRTGNRMEVYDFGEGARAQVVQFPDGHIEVLPNAPGRGAEVYDFVSDLARKKKAPFWSGELHNLSGGAAKRWERMVAEGKAIYDAKLQRFVAVP